VRRRSVGSAPVSPPIEALEPRLHGEREFEVDDRLLTDVGGTLGVRVLSTPAMIGMMERTAAMLVHPHLPEAQATVGFEVRVKHVRGARRAAPAAPPAPHYGRSSTAGSCSSTSRSSRATR
jgi:acyl-coenzyme A thioesterase PaaI-like protein